MSKYSNSRQRYSSGRPNASGRSNKLLPLERLDSTVTKLCDLHVYKVPPDLWRENFNNILNNVVTETVSIGIIRVPSETRLADLREEIIQQLQPDDMGPRDWVFLRSVGRSLTRLRSKQEYQLKAKHFLPPVSFAPELYILEATPEVRDALAISDRGSSQSPPLSRRTSPSHRGYPNAYRNGYGGDNHVHRAPTSSGVRKHPLRAHTPPYHRNNTQHHDSHYHSTPTPPHYNDHHHNTNNGNHYSKDTDIHWSQREHDYNVHRKPHTPPEELWGREKPKAKVESPVVAHARVEVAAAPVVMATSSRDSPDKSASGDYRRRPDDDSGVADISPDDDYHNSNNNIGGSDRRQHSRSSRRDEYDLLSKRLESERFNMDDETDEERRRRLEDLEGRNMMDRDRWEADQEERRRQAEEDRKREEEERRRREEEERRRRREDSEERRKKEEEERRRRKEAEEEEERRREEERRLLAAKEEEERLRIEAKSPEDEPVQRDTESARQRRREEMARLLAEAAEARKERQEQEKEREELVKKAKALQHKTTNRRNDARDMWKKKYFEEKKKTSPLEESSNRLRQELEALHRRLMNTLEGPKEKNLRLMDNQPSRKNNYVIQCTKLQHDIEDLQRRVANAKMKLTAEMKLRNQAQGELRALRAELAQRKHNINKSRQQQLAALTPRPPPAASDPQENGYMSTSQYGGTGFGGGGGGDGYDGEMFARQFGEPPLPPPALPAIGRGGLYV